MVITGFTLGDRNFTPIFVVSKNSNCEPRLVVLEVPSGCCEHISMVPPKWDGGLTCCTSCSGASLAARISSKVMTTTEVGNYMDMNALNPSFFKGDTMSSKFTTTLLLQNNDSNTPMPIYIITTLQHNWFLYFSHHYLGISYSIGHFLLALFGLPRPTLLTYSPIHGMGRIPTPQYGLVTAGHFGGVQCWWKADSQFKLQLLGRIGGGKGQFQHGISKEEWCMRLTLLPMAGFPFGVEWPCWSWRWIWMWIWTCNLRWRNRRMWWRNII